MNNNSCKISPICYVWKEHGNTFHEQFCVSKKLRSQDSCLVFLSFPTSTQNSHGLHSCTVFQLPCVDIKSRTFQALQQVLCPYSTCPSSPHLPEVTILHLSPYGILLLTSYPVVTQIIPWYLLFLVTNTHSGRAGF